MYLFNNHYFKVLLAFGLMSTICGLKHHMLPCTKLKYFECLQSITKDIPESLTTYRKKMYFSKQPLFGQSFKYRSRFISVPMKDISYTLFNFLPNNFLHSLWAKLKSPVERNTSPLKLQNLNSLLERSKLKKESHTENNTNANSTEVLNAEYKIPEQYVASEKQSSSTLVSHHPLPPFPVTLLQQPQPGLSSKLISSRIPSNKISKLRLVMPKESEILQPPTLKFPNSLPVASQHSAPKHKFISRHDTNDLQKNSNPPNDNTTKIIFENFSETSLPTPFHKLISNNKFLTSKLSKTIPNNIQSSRHFTSFLRPKLRMDGISSTFDSFLTSDFPKIPSMENTSFPAFPEMPLLEENFSFPVFPEMPPFENSSFPVFPKKPLGRNSSFLEFPEVPLLENISFPAFPKLRSVKNTSFPIFPENSPEENSSYSIFHNMPSKESSLFRAFPQISPLKNTSSEFFGRLFRKNTSAPVFPSMPSMKNTSSVISDIPSMENTAFLVFSEFSSRKNTTIPVFPKMQSREITFPLLSKRTPIKNTPLPVFSKTPSMKNTSSTVLPKILSMRNSSYSVFPEMPTDETFSLPAFPEIPSRINSSFPKFPEIPSIQNISFPVFPKMLSMKNASLPVFPSRINSSFSEFPELPLTRNRAFPIFPEMPIETFSLSLFSEIPSIKNISSLEYHNMSSIKNVPSLKFSKIPFTKNVTSLEFLKVSSIPNIVQTNSDGSLIKSGYSINDSYEFNTYNLTVRY